MDDRPWLQVTIYRCPGSKRRKVARLLSEYVSLGDGVDRVDDGGVYEAEEAPENAGGHLATRLIRLAPHCSFTVVQDECGVHHYTPRLGRFDGMNACGSEVLLDLGDTVRILDRCAVWGSTMLSAAFEVAYGVPWETELLAQNGKAQNLTPEPGVEWSGSPRERAWLAVIDDRYKTVTANLITRVTEFVRTLGELAEETFRTDLALWGLRDRVGQGILARDLPALVLSLGGLCHALAEARDDGKLGPPAEPGQVGSAARNLPMTASALACVVSDVYEGRRR